MQPVRHPEGAKANEGDAGSFSNPFGVIVAGGATTNPHGVLGSNASMDTKYTAASLALMHMPSGLFVQGYYQWIDMAAQDPIDPQTNGPQLFYGLRYDIHINTPEEKDHVSRSGWLLAVGTCDRFNHRA